jgi:hypothetical protein
MKARTLLLVAAALLVLSVSVAAQDTVRFSPAVGYSTFAVSEPVLTVRPGTVLISNTNFGGYYTEEVGLSAILWHRAPPAGPFPVKRLSDNNLDVTLDIGALVVYCIGVLIQ